MEQKDKPNSGPRRFAGLGIQMLAVIALAAWAGYWLDGRLHLKFPVFTLGLVMVGFAGILVKIWYQMNQD